MARKDINYPEGSPFFIRKQGDRFQVIKVSEDGEEELLGRAPSVSKAKTLIEEVISKEEGPPSEEEQIAASLLGNTNVLSNL